MKLAGAGINPANYLDHEAPRSSQRLPLQTLPRKAMRGLTFSNSAAREGLADGSSLSLATEGTCTSWSRQPPQLRITAPPLLAHMQKEAEHHQADVLCQASAHTSHVETMWEAWCADLLCAAGQLTFGEFPTTSPWPLCIAHPCDCIVLCREAAHRMEHGCFRNGRKVTGIYIGRDVHWELSCAMPCCETGQLEKIIYLKQRVACEIVPERVQICPGALIQHLLVIC